MSGAPTNVINMQARGRLIREAQEAREKRKAERAEADGICKICGGPAAIGARVCLKCSVNIAFPGGIDDLNL